MKRKKKYYKMSNYQQICFDTSTDRICMTIFPSSLINNQNSINTQSSISLQNNSINANNCQQIIPPLSTMSTGSSSDPKLQKLESFVANKPRSYIIYYSPSCGRSQNLIQQLGGINAYPNSVLFVQQSDLPPSFLFNFAKPGESTIQWPSILPYVNGSPQSLLNSQQFLQLIQQNPLA